MNIYLICGRDLDTGERTIFHAFANADRALADVKQMAEDAAANLNDAEETSEFYVESQGNYFFIKNALNRIVEEYYILTVALYDVDL